MWYNVRSRLLFGLKRRFHESGLLLGLAILGSGLASLPVANAAVAPVEVTEFGHDQNVGNLLAIAPALVPDDYRSAATLSAKLSLYLEAARSKGWLGTRTVVVLPEFVGGWLVAVGESDSVYQATSLNGAMFHLIWAHLGQIARGYLAAHSTDRLREAVFQAKSKAMAEAYQATMSQLAARYHVTLVAGSSVLPGAYSDHGRLALHLPAPLEIVAAVYGPDGQLLGEPVRKIHLVPEEHQFAQSAAVSTLPVFETPAGKLGVMVCADSWYADTYDRLVGEGARLIAVPAYVEKDHSWLDAWGGYTAGPPGVDYDSHDPGHITEGQAWEKYTVFHQLARFPGVAGVTTFLRGSLWGLGSDGDILAHSAKSDNVKSRFAQGSGIVNLWLDPQIPQKK